MSHFLANHFSMLCYERDDLAPWLRGKIKWCWDNFNGRPFVSVRVLIQRANLEGPLKPAHTWLVDFLGPFTC
jgi:hypothetical protein